MFTAPGIHRTMLSQATIKYICFYHIKFTCTTCISSNLREKYMKTIVDMNKVTKNDYNIRLLKTTNVRLLKSKSLSYIINNSNNNETLL